MKKLIGMLLVVSMILSGFMIYPESSKVLAAIGIDSSGFLKANGKSVRNNYGNGDVVYLRGTNVGSLSVQEQWMSTFKWSNNVKDQSDIWRVLTNRFGEDNARRLIRRYMECYFTTSDFDHCVDMGINVLRLPLWYRDFVDSNGNWLSDCWEYVDWFVSEAGKRGIYVIIDMHGAYGSQNGSDHSGVDGQDAKEAASKFFFGSNAASNQEKYYQMWERIAAHFKGNPAVAGYDLLNEPFCTYRYNSSVGEDTLHSILWNVYDIAYDRIRAIDGDHMIIMEATWDSWDLPNPSNYGWSNVMYEYHQYEYSNYSNENNVQITSLQNKINNIFAMNHNVPSYLGEFNLFNSDAAWDTGLQMLRDNGLHWTTWTYKAKTSNDNWGLYKYSADEVDLENDSYDTIYQKWSSVGSDYENTYITNVMKKYTPGTAKTVDYATIGNGDYYLSVTENDGAKVVCAEDSGNKPLVANRDSCGGAWETLQVVNNADGTISFKSVINGKYVCAVIDENNQLLARSDAINDWEKFKLVQISGNQYGILACANGKYVKADFGYTDNVGELRAASDSVAGSWEAFTFTKLGNSEPETQTPEHQTTAEPTTEQPTTVSNDLPAGFQAGPDGLWSQSGNWGSYFGNWSGGAAGGYKLNTDNSYEVYVKSTNIGVDWLIQAKYETAVTSGKQYRVSVDVYADQAASVGIKEDASNEGIAQVYTDIGAGSTATLTGTYRMDQGTMRLMFELGRGVQPGTTLKFSNVRINEVVEETAPEQTTKKEETTKQSEEPVDTTWYQVGSSNYYVAAMNNEFEFQFLENQTTQMLIIPRVAEGKKPIWPDYSEVSLNGQAFNQPAGAGIYIPYEKLARGENVFQANSAVDGHTFKIIIRNDNPEETTAESTTAEPTTAEPTTEEPTTEKKIASVEIKGYQINTQVEGHRVIYTVDDPNHEVTEKGLIFGLDTYASKDAMTVGSTANTVYSVAAIKAGQVSNGAYDTETNSTYAMTMRFIKTKNYYNAGIMVRAYAKLSSGEYIYSDVHTTNIYNIADSIYQKKSMATEAQHNYLFDNILNKCKPEYERITF